MLKKESKIRVMENFISLDYLFFGKTIHEMDADLNLAKQYIELKGSLCGIMVEMYSLMEHNPAEFDKVLTESDIEDMAIKAASVARQNVRRIITTDSGKANLRESIYDTLHGQEDINIEETVNYKIQEKSFQIGMDNMLIARAISESEKVDIMETFEGKILEDTYKSVRDSIVETALAVIYDI
jgi:hypothetical protein